MCVELSVLAEPAEVEAPPVILETKSVTFFAGALIASITCLLRLSSAITESPVRAAEALLAPRPLLLQV
jgi:hypothetical protein